MEESWLLVMRDLRREGYAIPERPACLQPERYEALRAFLAGDKWADIGKRRGVSDTRARHMARQALAALERHKKRLTPCLKCQAVNGAKGASS